MSLILAAPAVGVGQIDYTTYTAEVPVTSSDIAAFTGQGTVTLNALTVDPNGDIITYTRRGAADTNAKLVRIDVSGSSPQFTTIATEAQLLAEMDSTGPIVYHLEVDTAGTVYLQEWINSGAFGDDILKIVPGGGSPTVTNLRRVIGVSGVTLSHDETELIIAQSNNYLASSNDLVTRSVNGGADVVLSSDGAISAVTGASEAGLRTRLVKLSNGNYAVWDESIFDGSDQILEITPSGTVSVLVATGDVNPGIGANVLSFVGDDEDTLYLWSQVASPADVGLILFEDAGVGTMHKHSKASIDAALTAAHGSAFAVNSTGVGGHFASHSTPTRKTLYITTGGDIAALHFDAAGSSVGQWDAY